MRHNVKDVPQVRDVKGRSMQTSQRSIAAVQGCGCCRVGAAGSTTQSCTTQCTVNVNVNVNSLLAISILDLDNSGEPGPQAKGVNHLETPLRQLHITHRPRASSCAKRGGHVPLCSKPRGACTSSHVYTRLTAIICMSSAAASTGTLTFHSHRQRFVGLSSWAMPGLFCSLRAAQAVLNMSLRMCTLCSVAPRDVRTLPI